MRELIDPTAEQVKEFCALMQSNLLAALDRGSRVLLMHRTHTQEVFSPDYGSAPVDLLHVGETFTAKFRERVV